MNWGHDRNAHLLKAGATTIMYPLNDAHRFLPSSLSPYGEGLSNRFVGINTYLGGSYGYLCIQPATADVIVCTYCAYLQDHEHENRASCLILVSTT
jgi:hypothetical protein